MPRDAIQEDARYVTKADFYRLRKLEGQSKTDNEKLEILDGSRGKNVDVLKQAAVRIEDLNGILQIPDNLMQSTFSAGFNPTQPEFDQLRLDVMRLYDQLISVAKALQERLKP